MSILKCFFDGFLRFWLDLGTPQGPQKSIKNRKNRVWDVCGARSRFLIVFWTVLGRFGEGLGTVLGRFWEGFGRIFEIFGRNLGEAFQVEELALMIRATRSRSIDR